MTKRIIVTLDVPLVHYWSEATNYLKNPHRHLFHVICKKDVTDNNREIEFIAFKEGIQGYLNKLFPFGETSCSCEDIAENLFKQFALSYCAVLEDNENGAEICE